MIIIDGKKVSEHIKENIKKEISIPKTKPYLVV